MSYAQDCFARLGHELEVFDSLLSEASVASQSPRAFNETASAEDSVEEGVNQEQQDSHRKPIHDILTAIRPSGNSTSLPSVNSLLTLVQSLQELKQENTRFISEQDEELRIAALARLICATYAVAIETLLQDASKMDEESWYWTEIDESMRKTFAFLIQTLPSRLARMTRETLELAAGSASHTLRSTLDVSTTSIAKSVDRAALRKTLRNVRDTPNLITSMLFPYTFHLERSITFDSQFSLRLSDRIETSKSGGIIRSKQSRVKSLRSTVLNLTPQYLVRHEARCKRRGLFNERDHLAEKLGRLALQKDLTEDDELLDLADHDPKLAVLKQLNKRLNTLVECFQSEEDASDQVVPDTATPIDATLNNLRKLLEDQMPKQQERIRQVLSPEIFGQPSGFTQRWPTLLVYPLSILLMARYLSKNWTGIEAKLVETKETLRSFFVGWVWEPCVQLLDTIRSGNEGSVIMSRESLNSDLQSLERMVSDFTSDKYGVKGDELATIAARVREGDLTHVLKVYESEMKSPVKSMVSGSLIRALLIQIQKAKVDLEVAMSGIDKLLKSQQLLFGAVGIAPALGVVFISQRYVRNKVANVSSYRSQSMGQTYQIRAWEAMRRVDRLLSAPIAKADARSAQPSHPRKPDVTQIDETRDPLTQGLLLLDLSTLRSVSGPLLMNLAKGNKATTKRLQRHFLQDIRDIECGQRSAVERMWRSWGSALRAT